ncbi:tautomerase family protein [Streptomyces sp. NBC_00510]
MQEAQPGDGFPLVHRHDPGDMILSRDFRFDPRCEEWIVVSITMTFPLPQALGSGRA